MRRRNINFDVNATEMPSKHVLKSLEKLYKSGYNNPSSVYFEGIKTSEMIEEARLKVAKALNCKPEEIFFTSGASESNSWVYNNYKGKMNIHSSSHHSLSMLKTNNESKIISFPYVVSETGIVLGTKERKKDKIYFADLTQAIGRVYIDLEKEDDIAFASASGHKFGGILGCGILFIRKDYQNKIKPIIYGSQEKGLRGGTENVPAIVSFGIAIEDAMANMDKNNLHNFKIIDYLCKNLSLLDCKIKQHLNVINITFKNLPAQSAVQLFDKNGINISAGSACNSGTDKPSQAYLDAGYSKEEALRTIRVSVGCNNTMREAKKIIKIIKKIIDNYDF